MRHWISIGPVHIRISSKNLAPWGFPRVHVGGYSFWCWSNDGWFMPASYHPKNSITWVWAAYIGKFGWNKSYKHNCGSESYFWLPFGFRLRIARQRPMWREDNLKIAA